MQECPACKTKLQLEVDHPRVELLVCPTCEFVHAEVQIRNRKISLLSAQQGVSINVFQLDNENRGAVGWDRAGNAIKFILPSASFFAPYEDDR